MKGDGEVRTQSLDTDVLIIGAGPTGLVCANLLGDLGVRTIIVERNSTTVQEPRAVSIDDESLRTVQATGMLRRVMEQIVPGYGSRYLTPSGACFLTVLPSGRPYGHPRRNAFRQPRFEQTMREGLERFSQLTALFGWTLTSFNQDAERVQATIRNGGNERIVRARFMVAADGGSSFVRKALGFKLEGETLPERWLIVDLENSPAERDTLVFCDSKRPCIALPGPEGTRRFEFKLFNGESEGDILKPDSVGRLLSWRGAAGGSRIVRQTVYTFHARIADRWRKDRIFLAGDAAHLTPPFAGQGMNSGIRDANNLAWKLAAVISGRLPDRLLESYEQERREHVRAMIDLALTMGRIMGPSSRLSGWLTQTAFRLAGSFPRLRSYFGEMKYKPQPRLRRGFLLRSRGTLVGTLLPQPTVRNKGGAEALLDDLLPKGFVLIGVDVAPDAFGNVSAAFVESSLAPGAVNLTTESTGELELTSRSPLLEKAAKTVLLVRPDRYVMAQFEPREARAVAEAVETLSIPLQSR